jgi:hypothetical protein
MTEPALRGVDPLLSTTVTNATISPDCSAESIGKTNFFTDYHLTVIY